MTRSEIFALELHVSEKTGVNTEKNLKKIRKFHMNTLPAGKVPGHESEVIIGIYICEDYANPAVHCVYNELDDECGEYCLYCSYPAERK